MSRSATTNDPSVETRVLPDLIFISAVLPRSGSNLLSRNLLAHPRVVRPEGHWELPLTNSFESFSAFHSDFLSKRAPGRLDYTEEDFCRAFGRGFMELLVERCPEWSPATKYIVHKNVSTIGIDRVLSFFPSAHHLVLIRDGRDVASSILAKSGLTRLSPRRLRNLTGQARQWAASAQRIQQYVQDPEHSSHLVRFEDLVHDSTRELEKIGEFLGFEGVDGWTTAAAGTTIRGSSFLRQEDDENPFEEAGPANWEEIEATTAFSPVGRWREFFSPVEESLFRIFAGRELEAFGYLDATRER